MKIKILKDIPGYKAGEIQQVEFFLGKDASYEPKNRYVVETLISDGWAEEVKDEIDMEEIRNKAQYWIKIDPIKGVELKLTKKEVDWFTACRIVKAVIEKLNGDWKPDWNTENTNKFTIKYAWDEKKIVPEWNQFYMVGVLPYMKDKQTAEKVISLCEPELKILFGVE